MPDHELSFDPASMYMLPTRPVVLFERVGTAAPRFVLVYAPQAALAAAEQMRAAFSSLLDFPFRLRRGAWHLKTDGNRQRMVMIGARIKGRNSGHRKQPTWKRPWLWRHVQNVRGDVGTYTSTLQAAELSTRRGRSACSRKSER